MTTSSRSRPTDVRRFSTRCRLLNRVRVPETGLIHSSKVQLRLAKNVARVTVGMVTG
jgi:hypothetical protein